MFGMQSNARDRRHRSALKPVIEGLELREVYAVSVSLSGSGALTVNISGTDAKQHFELSVYPDRTMKYFDGIELHWLNATNGQKATTGMITSITVNGSGLSNRVKLDKVLSKYGFRSSLDNPSNPKIVVNAGDGDDFISGSEFADRVNAGSGNDKIYGNEGHDTLIAGSGTFADSIYGGGGDDYVEAMSYTDDGRSIFDGGNQFSRDRFVGKRPRIASNVKGFENVTYR